MIHHLRARHHLPARHRADGAVGIEYLHAHRELTHRHEAVFQCQEGMALVRMHHFAVLLNKGAVRQLCVQKRRAMLVVATSMAGHQCRPGLILSAAG